MGLTQEQIAIGILKGRYFSVDDALVVIAWAISEGIDVIVESSTWDDVDGKKSRRVEVRVPGERW